MDFDYIQTKLALSQHTPIQSLPLVGLKPSAVLIVIEHSNDDPKILLTQRPFHLRSHPGQFCFPGGKFDSTHDISLLDTAIRETAEEIGLSSSTLSPICKLSEFKTFSGFAINAYVAQLTTPADLTLNAGEVKQVIKLPLRYILKPTHFGRLRLKREKMQYDVFLINFAGNFIWGATAGLLVDLACRLSDKPTYFLNQIPIIE